MAGFMSQKMKTSKENAYICPKCNKATVVVHPSEITETTPFLICCRATTNCEGTARSCFYFATTKGVRPDVLPSPQFEWYMDGETLKLRRIRRATGIG
jgi:hypothetical protein